MEWYIARGISSDNLKISLLLGQQKVKHVFFRCNGCDKDVVVTALGNFSVNPKMTANEIDSHVRRFALAVFVVREIVRVPKLGSSFVAAKIIR